MSKKNKALDFGDPVKVINLPSYLDEPTINKKKIGILESNEQFCYDKSEGYFESNGQPTDEQAYHLGAYHAFSDTLDLLYRDLSEEELEDAKRNISVRTKLVITAVVITAGVVAAPHLEKRFKIKDKLRGAKENVVKEIAFIRGTVRG